MTARRRTTATLAGLLLLPLASASPSIAADVATGAVLAGSCANCHGPGGASPGAMPSIDKLGANELAGRMKSFRSGETPATVMTRIAKGYTDAEIEAISQYFATRPH